LSLSSQSSRSCAGLKIKVLKDKGLEFANSIGTFFETMPRPLRLQSTPVRMPSTNFLARHQLDMHCCTEFLCTVCRQPCPSRIVYQYRAFFCVSRLRMPLVPSALAHARSVSATESPSSVHQPYHGSVSIAFPVQYSQEEKAASDDGDML
jgi:hypothetical protein